MRFLVLIGVLAIQVSCARLEQQTPEPQIASCLDGRVAVLPGPTSEPLIQTTEGRFIAVGEDASELTRLESGEVEVCGEITRVSPVGRIDLLSYRVVRMNGVPAWSGVLIAEVHTIYLQTEDDRLPLSGPTDSLVPLVGSKVWVSGERVAEGVRLSSFGLIRAP